MKTSYCSVAAGKIYQEKPVITRPSRFRPKGWTETVAGYIQEAKKLTMCILKNRRLMGRDYTWTATISIEVVHSPAQITDLWTRTCRALREKGLVALWVREPTRSNKVHYHILIKNIITRKELKRIITAAMPNLREQTVHRKRRGWHMRLQPVTNLWQLSHYITKAKIPGFRNGHRVADYYAAKRLLFQKNLNLKKYGCIGPFWERSKTDLWNGIKDVERRITEGLDNPDVRRLAEHVHSLLDGCVPLKRIERSFGYWSQSSSIRDWLTQVDGQDDSDG